MIYKTESRGVANVVGFILIIAIITIFIAQYQTSIVPQEEENEEARHYNNILQDMGTLQSEIVKTAGSGQLNNVPLSIGIEYDSGLISRPPKSGSFSHIDFDNNIKIANAESNHEGTQLWTGDNIIEYETGYLSYTPDYTRYNEHGELFIEHGFYYEDFNRQQMPREADLSQVLERSSPQIIDGQTITLYTISDGLDDGELIDTGRSSITAELTPVSPEQGGSMNTINIESSEDPIEIVLPTRLPASEWEDIMEDELVENGGNIDDIIEPDEYSQSEPDIDDDDNVVVIRMEQGEVYNLRSSKINIQTDSQTTPVDNTETQYIHSMDSLTIREETSVNIEAQARDKYNNGVVGEEVLVEAQSTAGVCVGGFSQESDENPTCEDGDLNFGQPGFNITNEEGNATFQYNAPNVPEDTQVDFIFRLID